MTSDDALECWSLIIYDKISQQNVPKRSKYLCKSFDILQLCSDHSLECWSLIMWGCPRDRKAFTPYGRRCQRSFLLCTYSSSSPPRPSPFPPLPTSWWFSNRITFLVIIDVIATAFNIIHTQYRHDHHHHHGHYVAKPGHSLACQGLDWV